MVIQRIQSVYLLVATVLLVVFPFAGGCDARGCVALSGAVMLTVCLLDAILTAICIFRYRNLRSQISLCGVCALLSAVPLALTAVSAMRASQCAAATLLPALMPLAALLLQLLARRAMRADKRLLADS